jgi:hypothetical protein
MSTSVGRSCRSFVKARPSGVGRQKTRRQLRCSSPHLGRLAEPGPDERPQRRVRRARRELGQGDGELRGGAENGERLRALEPGERVPAAGGARR